MISFYTLGYIMNTSVTLGLMVALGAGVAIGLQGLFTNLTGQILGPARGYFQASS